MDKLEIRRVAQALYEDELQYSIARDDEVDLARCKSRAAIRLGRDMENEDISGVWLGYIEGISRHSEKAFEDDLTAGNLRIGGTIRTAANTMVPSQKARRRDVLSHEAMRELKFSEHETARKAQRAAAGVLLGRIDAYGGDPTLLEACPDLFDGAEEEAA